MSAVALLLVLGSGLVHASWNLLLKKSGGGTGLLALTSILSLALWTPVVVAAAVLQGYRFAWIHLALVLASGTVHTTYVLLLDRAYRSGGDLSIVYPVARATGPLLSIVPAMAFFGERPGHVALAGAVLIGLSALLLAGNPLAWKKADARRAMGFALLTGLTIAVYTTLDKRSVAVWLIPAIVYDWGGSIVRVGVLVPLAVRRSPGDMTRAWREHRGSVLAIATLAPLSYVLVLTAMVFTPVSLVAPAREVSILFAVLAGGHFLQEGDTARRLVAAAGMVAGLSCLALG